MFDVTDSAAGKIADYCRENNVTTPIRIAAMQSCSGPALGLSVDEQRDDDTVKEIGDGFIVLVNNDLLKVCDGIKVDFVESSCSSGGCGGGGFKVTSTKPLGGSSEGCGGSCSSGCGC
ncbi:MAG: IscA/HesB family protein [Desulfobulbaceae bacterium]|nr:IscA/HesB family protein [Desulfobulbaceae bacterium]